MRSTYISNRFCGCNCWNSAQPGRPWRLNSSNEKETAALKKISWDNLPENYPSWISPRPKQFYLRKSYLKIQRCKFLNIINSWWQADIMTVVDTTSKFVEVLSRGTVHSCSVANQNQFSFFFILLFLLSFWQLLMPSWNVMITLKLNFLQSKQFFSIHSNFSSWQKSREFLVNALLPTIVSRDFRNVVVLIYHKCYVMVILDNVIEFAF